MNDAPDTSPPITVPGAASTEGHAVSSRARARFAATMVGITLAVAAPTANAVSPLAFSESALGRVLEPYLKGNVDSPAALRQLFRQDLDTVPPPVLLALADGLLRAHKIRMAAATLEEALTRTADPDVAVWALFGLGWIDLASGDPTSARGHFELIVQDHQWGADTAAALVGLTRASGGDRSAAAQFDVAATAAGTSYALRVACRLLGGYARYWDAQYAEASESFALAASEYPDTPLTDDARYGAAWSRYRAGERGTAIADLRVLAAEASTAYAWPAPLVDLGPDEVFRETLRRYRGAGAQSPDTLLVQMLDLDGHRLARTALARIDTPGEAPRSHVEADPAIDRDPVPADNPSVRITREQPLPPTGPADGHAHRSLGVSWLLPALLGIAVLLAARRRRQARGTTTLSGRTRR